MPYKALIKYSKEFSSRRLATLPTREQLEATEDERRRQWLDMLGLYPFPEKNDLKPTITGVLERGGYRIEKMHLEFLPGTRIAANIYVPDGEGPFPTVLYLCGHGSLGKGGGTQCHAAYFAQHGYICMLLDTIENGESVSVHNGTMYLNRWHWISRGYTPAGVEVWSAMRALDYLETRSDVDADKFGVTGISGGGQLSWFSGAADKRLKVIAPVAQVGPMDSEIVDRFLDGHCDCAFWVNTHGWDYTDIHALVVPRALCLGIPLEDCLCDPAAFGKQTRRLRKLYRLFDAEDHLLPIEDTARHNYSKPILAGLFSHFERFLKGVPKQMSPDLPKDKEDIEDLWVYPGGKSPADDRLATVDDWFIPTPELPEITDKASWEAHQDKSIRRLKDITFNNISSERLIPSYEIRSRGLTPHSEVYLVEFESEPGISVQANIGLAIQAPHKPAPLVIAPTLDTDNRAYIMLGGEMHGVSWITHSKSIVQTRGTGCTSIGEGLKWFLHRAYPLFGQSLYERRVFDLLRTVDIFLEFDGVGDIYLSGHGDMAAVAIYAALLEPRIAGVILHKPVTTHDNAGPEFPRVLQVGDLPHNLALLFPRPITFVEEIPEEYKWVREVYEKLGEGDKISIVGPECAL